MENLLSIWEAEFNIGQKTERHSNPSELCSTKSTHSFTDRRPHCTSALSTRGADKKGQTNENICGIKWRLHFFFIFSRSIFFDACALERETRAGIRPSGSDPTLSHRPTFLFRACCSFGLSVSFFLSFFLRPSSFFFLSLFFFCAACVLPTATSSCASHCPPDAIRSRRYHPYLNLWKDHVRFDLRRRRAAAKITISFERGPMLIPLFTPVSHTHTHTHTHTKRIDYSLNLCSTRVYLVLSRWLIVFPLVSPLAFAWLDPSARTSLYRVLPGPAIGLCNGFKRGFAGVYPSPASFPTCHSGFTVFLHGSNQRFHQMDLVNVRRVKRIGCAL